MNIHELLNTYHTKGTRYLARRPGMVYGGIAGRLWSRMIRSSNRRRGQ